MIGELCDATGIARRQVYHATLAGNTTMQQIFCGIDPGPLGEVPFVAAVRQGLAFPAAEGGLGIHPRGRVYVLPIIGAFVGGDIVGGILATGLADCTSPTLLIDIGTNGEIVLAADGKLTATSTAAGPGLRRGQDRPRHEGQPRGDRRRSFRSRPDWPASRGQSARLRRPGRPRSRWP